MIVGILWEDRPGVNHHHSDPCRYRVDGGAAACRCRWGLGWRWDQSWCRRRRDRARSLRPRLGARKPVLL